MPEPDRLLKLPEVAELLGVSRRTVDRLIAAGKLVKVNHSARASRVPQSSLVRYQEQLIAAATA